MISSSLLQMRRLAAGLGLCAAMTGLAAAPAHAWIGVGIGIPFYGPSFYPAPYYYPPPTYYAPPPVYYSQPQTYTPAPQAYTPAPQAGGQICYAGSYTCPMDRPVAAGSGCYCLGNGGQRVWGRSN
jgi:hypothetical protein